MSVTKAQLVGGVGLSTVGNLTVFGGVNATGVVTASSFSGDGSNLTNTGSTLSAASGSQRVVVTTQTSGTMTAAATDSDLTFDSNSNTLNTANLHVTGISTLGTTNGIGKVTIGIGTTALLVEGNARVTGILTVGTSSITLDGDNNAIRVGSGVTISASTGLSASGANLTALNASNISSGTLAIARLAVASQAQAEAGTDTATVMTPQRVAQALAALAGGGQVVTTTFTSSGTFTKNADDLFYFVHLIGGGGGGGAGNQFTSHGYGGGGGAGFFGFLLASSVPGSVSITIGAGGGSGIAGGDSIFGNILKSCGGSAGVPGSYGNGGRVLPTSVTSGSTASAETIFTGGNITNTFSIFGGGTGGINDASSIGYSVFAGNGGPGQPEGSNATSANNGVIPGGGGGGVRVSGGGTAASGARGECRIYAIRKK